MVKRICGKVGHETREINTIILQNVHIFKMISNDILWYP